MNAKKIIEVGGALVLLNFILTLAITAYAVGTGGVNTVRLIGLFLGVAGVIAGAAVVYSARKIEQKRKSRLSTAWICSIIAVLLSVAGFIFIGGFVLGFLGGLTGLYGVEKAKKPTEIK
ncbi:hypothetical protein HY993_04015 [Candidatus Micrarchaeota archaeon]|nr:hypothetical protein [Candidatus Micrarchaeota archaeon]